MGLNRIREKWKWIAGAAVAIIGVLVAMRFFIPADTAVVPEKIPLPVQKEAASATAKERSSNQTASETVSKETAAVKEPRTVQKPRVVEGQIVVSPAIDFAEIQKDAAAASHGSGSTVSNASVSHASVSHASGSKTPAAKPLPDAPPDSPVVGSLDKDSPISVLSAGSTGDTGSSGTSAGGSATSTGTDIKASSSSGTSSEQSPVVTMMNKRKQTLGIKNSMDMIIRSDESFIIGGKKIEMSRILEEAFTQKGEIFQEKIAESGESRPQTVREYGIYVVRPGDNIWNIHFDILREYYQSRGVRVEPMADEPVNGGISSGVGKILKFSETIAIIYNITDEKIVRDINLLQPLSKIVIYNMSEVFDLLREINYTNVNRIQFDGRTIWIPAGKTLKSAT